MALGYLDVCCPCGLPQSCCLLCMNPWMSLQKSANLAVANVADRFSIAVFAEKV